MRPFLGLTCTHDEEGRPCVKPDYVAALLAAGAVAVSLPFVADEDEAAAILERLDGLVLSGGRDLDPALWGEPRHPQMQPMHAARQVAELAYARVALRGSLPTLGICAGMQTLNVAAGGSLHQHLPDLSADLVHQAVAPEDRHPVRTRPGSLAATLLGEELHVNSHHHQGVARLGAGLVASAYAPDGVIEAIERRDHPFLLGVQWHPERMRDDRLQQRLFEAFVAAARGN